MPLPVILRVDPGAAGHHPPFKSSGGAFYVVVIDDLGTNDAIDVHKATDPTDTFSIQDFGSNPVLASNRRAAVLSVVQKGDVLYMAHANASDSTGITLSYNYHEFDMATDTWSVTEEQIDNLTNDPTFGWISIAVRSDGDVVVVYAGDTDQNMGGKKERVDANVRSGSPASWGGPIALDAGGDVHYGDPNCVLGTNDFVHCVWQTTTNTTDPPGTWATTQASSVDPADDGLSARVSSVSDSNANILGFASIVSYEDGSDQKVLSGGYKPSTNEFQPVEGTEDVNDEITLFGSSGRETDFTTNGWYANGDVGVHTFAALGSDIHALYSGGGSDGVDQDLYYIKSTNDGTDWSTETEEIAAITVNFISANIYVRGLDTVLAYVYDDGGVQKYNEKVLIAGAAGLPLQSQSVLQAVSRMGYY